MHSSGMRGGRSLDGLETLRPGELETCGLGLVMEPEFGQICPNNQRDSLT